MTPEEREQLREGLKAAGCPGLASAVGDFLGGAYIAELRSLLRREVWVVRDWARNATIGVCSTQERAVQVGSPYGTWSAIPEMHTIDAEVPDGQS